MVDQRKTRPHHHPHKAAAMISCPRCNSGNTKFCYYNNYSLSQPRYFCKSCRRYWTEGGSLRNIPVGGGSRRKSTSKKPLNINNKINNNNNNNSMETHGRQQNPRSHDECDFTTIDELIRVPTYGPSSGLEPNIANAAPSMAPLGFGVAGGHGIGSSNHGSFQGMLETGGMAVNKLPFPFIVHQVSDNGGGQQNGDSSGNFWSGGSYW